jgi:hypothetical protein
MIHRVRARLTYANVMATIAVFIALGGSSYAALKLPSNGVGATQIRTGAVRSAEIKNRCIHTTDLATSTRNTLRGPTGPKAPPNPYWAAINFGGGRIRGNAIGSSHAGDTGVYHLRFARDLSSCGAAVTLASVLGGAVEDPPAGRATVTPEAGGIIVHTYDTDGSIRDLPFKVVIAC